MLKIREALRKMGYISVIIGSGITGFLQVNDARLEKQLKREPPLTQAVFQVGDLFPA